MKVATWNLRSPSIPGKLVNVVAKMESFQDVRYKQRLMVWYWTNTNLKRHARKNDPLHRYRVEVLAVFFIRSSYAPEDWCKEHDINVIMGDSNAKVREGEVKGYAMLIWDRGTIEVRGWWNFAKTKSLIWWTRSFRQVNVDCDHNSLVAILKLSLKNLNRPKSRPTPDRKGLMIPAVLQRTQHEINKNIKSLADCSVFNYFFCLI